MEQSKIQGILSIIIVSTFMIVTGIIAIYTYANDLQGVTEGNITSNHLKDYFSLFTGIIGTIIGYYFGKNNPGKKSV
ncbi:MAG: hypothetical protein RIG77_20575 [Cyclobacteriaceae bacterium]